MRPHDVETEVWPDGEGPLRRETECLDGEQLIVDVAGFEGPLDLLLELARRQKVDISRISVLALAEQYLAFFNTARRLRLDLAAEYLVMAAWLAYLKSRLLLPEPASSDEPPAEELAARLAFRLQRLEAMRAAAAQLMARSRLGLDVFARGSPEPLIVERQVQYGDTLFDLLKAYAERRQRRQARQRYAVTRRRVWSVTEARAILERLLGAMDEWGRFEGWIADYLCEPAARASFIASSLTASLELTRDGKLELRQERAFEPIYMRRRNLPAGKM
ncbi:MAG TPA: ScpA family protein [Aestuariivirgaceae bacterium]|nr:ScpA family protein [Aestuariivirgaceae bacterium]